MPLGLFMKKSIKVGLLAVMSLLAFIKPPAQAELIFRGGYLVKILSTSGGYNEFLKERYGSTSPQLSGTALSVAFISWRTLVVTLLYSLFIDLPFEGVYQGGTSYYLAFYFSLSLVMRPNSFNRD